MSSARLYNAAMVRRIAAVVGATAVVAMGAAAVAAAEQQQRQQQKTCSLHRDGPCEVVAEYALAGCGVGVQRRITA